MPLEQLLMTRCRDILPDACQGHSMLYVARIMSRTLSSVFSPDTIAGSSEFLKVVFRDGMSLNNTSSGLS